MKRKQLAAMLTAAALTCSAMPSVGISAEETVLKYEFEDGKLEGCKEPPITWEQVDEDGFGNPCPMTGWSGDAYVYIDQKGAKATVTVDVPKDGFYALGISYIQCFGNPEKPDKTQYLLVNGESQGEVLFPFNSGKGWEVLPAGYVHLGKGENTITIESYWGYTFLDYLTLTDAPAYLTSFSPADSPCDPKASPEARKLYAYLRSVYGKHILAGQQEYCGSHCNNKNAYESQGKPINYLEDNEGEFEFLQENTGKQPAIRGIDFLFYNTTSPYYDDAPERVVAWYKDKGGIPTVTYHWNVPLEKGSSDVAFYVESAANGGNFTTFSITNAVTEGTWEHEQIDKDIALLAEQLKKASNAGVPILFRPLHEAEGGWFWWGAEGPEPCVKLYRYLYDQLTNKYDLHNLLWTWTCSTSAHAAEWYPGDEYVDFQGCDKYNAINYQPNESAISATFYSMVAQTEGQKMVVMSENDTIPSLANLTESKAGWLYFCPWYKNYLTDLNNKDTLKELYNSEYCITLDELPDWDTYDPELPEITTKPTTETTAPSGKALLGDVNCDGSVELKDAVVLAKANAGIGDALSVLGRQNADCTFDGKVDGNDLMRLLHYLAGNLTTTEFEAKP